MRLLLGNRKDCTRHVGPSVAGYGTEAATSVKYAATRLAWARATVEGPGHAATGSSIYSMQVERTPARSVAPTAKRLHAPRSALWGSPSPHPAGPRADRARAVSVRCCRKGLCLLSIGVSQAPAACVAAATVQTHQIGCTLPARIRTASLYNLLPCVCKTRNITTLLMASRACGESKRHCRHSPHAPVCAA